MGYYYQHNFSFSYHSLDRIRQRISEYKDMSDWQVKEKIIYMIDNSSDYIENDSYFYIKLDDVGHNLYVVIDKRSLLIITVTPMSAAKILKILE